MKKTLACMVLTMMAVSSLAVCCGCAGQGDPLRDLDRIRELYADTQSKVTHLTDFCFELEKFNLENARYYDEATAAIEESRSTAEEVGKKLDELGRFNFSGEMEELGRSLAEYRGQVEEALAELDEMYQPLLDILKALEPTLRAEAAITQMEAPQTDAEFTGRITRITEALKLTMVDLDSVQVPDNLRTFKLLQMEMFGALQRASGDLLALALGQSADVDVENNVDFARFESLAELNDTVVLDLKEALRVYDLDASMQEVEDDLYDLYLELGSRDEDKR